MSSIKAMTYRGFPAASRSNENLPVTTTSGAIAANVALLIFVLLASLVGVLCGVRHGRECFNALCRCRHPDARKSLQPQIQQVICVPRARLLSPHRPGPNLGGISHSELVVPAPPPSVRTTAV